MKKLDILKIINKNYFINIYMNNLTKIVLIVLVAFMLLKYSCSNSQKELFTKKKKKRKNY